MFSQLFKIFDKTTGTDSLSWYKIPSKRPKFPKMFLLIFKNNVFGRFSKMLIKTTLTIPQNFVIVS